LVAQGVVVDDCGDPTVAVADLRDAAPGLGIGEHDRPPLRVHPAGASPIGEPQGGIDEGIREYAPQAGGIRTALQPQPESLQCLGDEEPPAQKTDEEAERHRGQTERDDPPQRVDGSRIGGRDPDRDSNRQDGASSQSDGENRGERTAHEARRVPDPCANPRSHRQEQRHREELAKGSHSGVDEAGLRVEHEEGVRRTCVVAARVRGRHRVAGVDQRGWEVQHRDHPGDRPNQRTVHSRVQAAGGERQDQIDQL
jgi:hypothetical protein